VGAAQAAGTDTDGRDRELDEHALGMLAEALGARSRPAPKTDR